MDVERKIAPPMSLAITIPLSIDLRHSMHDGYTLYVSRDGFMAEARDSARVLSAIAKAIGDHLKTLPPFEV